MYYRLLNSNFDILSIVACILVENKIYRERSDHYYKGNNRGLIQKFRFSVQVKVNRFNKVILMYRGLIFFTNPVKNEF